MHLERELSNLKDILGERKAKRLSHVTKLKGTPSEQSSRKFETSNQQGTSIFQSNEKQTQFEDKVHIEISHFPSKDDTRPAKRKAKLISVIKKPVLEEDIKQYCTDLSLKLQLARISLDEVCSTIEKTCNQDGDISIAQLKGVLKSPPFDLEDKTVREMIARYLIEDHGEPRIVYNEQLTNSFTIVSTILRRLLEYYKIMTSEEEQAVKKQVKNNISICYRRLGYEMAGMKNKIGDFCTEKQLSDLLKANDAVMSKAELNLVILSLFRQTKDAQKLPYFSIFDLFEAQPLPD